MMEGAVLLPELLSQIEHFLPDLERQRLQETFANDLYEAASYWADLGRWALQGNTAVNYPERAGDEITLLRRLEGKLRNKPEDVRIRYNGLLEAAERLLALVSSVRTPEEGHLGFIKIVENLFGFVEKYGFTIASRQPTQLRFSSGAVYLNLECSKNTSISFSFGPESEDRQAYWIEDLLFMYGDARYRTVPQTINLSRNELEVRFAFVAEVLGRYGESVLSNESGIFERLKKAQADRDAEYVIEMDRRYGGSGSRS